MNAESLFSGAPGRRPRRSPVIGQKRDYTLVGLGSKKQPAHEIRRAVLEKRIEYRPARNGRRPPRGFRAGGLHSATTESRNATRHLLHAALWLRHGV